MPDAYGLDLDRRLRDRRELERRQQLLDAARADDVRLNPPFPYETVAFEPAFFRLDEAEAPSSFSPPEA